ncbi:hypothetical protein Q6A26_20350 [Xanthomonas euvesicatoria pv. eucalypti]|uniref:hypothetical protein n=1 Tax=Xanthomonas euvesicatoria TaxID=456327 RepID=UPI0026E44BFC|nr:hypothetical protein [Xanthomonas euvesicatoria]MDO7934425.1 hypothetical protein [Xanthomonas euvesicatoria pv. eucalypti]MDO7938569.1 hypothetical protein [Xanthomonas euvesicatoria pv. eucalypti]MDO7942796.1 hypothetical protein [Xanthomonas euvesicatoria pv. eucalypti]MDO7946986.1 hypothetical protein [Xanthomonas euvesicatoria pv. eucalypti]MDO7950890.1 hypothetical protein [Xanthomonas euvesicatoria pv. eucalypti]
MNINAIQQGDTLLRAFTEMVRKNLEAELLEQIKPALRMAVDQAVGELQPFIRSYYDLAADQLLIKVTHKELPR